MNSQNIYDCQSYSDLKVNKLEKHKMLIIGIGLVAVIIVSSPAIYASNMLNPRGSHVAL
jgi:hypothetical protein